MSYVFMVDLFYFQIILHVELYARIHQIHYIEYSAYILHNLHPFSIFYNLSIFSFLSLCVSKCVA